MKAMASPTRTDDLFVDSFGVAIHFHRWSGSKKPKAIVQLAHGLGEHALRYEGLVADLVSAGYEVWADEHRGHGATGLEQWNGDYGRLGKLGPGGLNATIRAIEDFTKLIREQRPEVPIFFLGHSWGSLMGQKILNRGGGHNYVGMVMTGTAYRMPGFMNAGDLNSQHKHLGTIGAEWLSRDVAVHEKWRDDPLTFVANTLKLLGPIDAARLIGKPKPLDTDIPLLLMVGSDDALGGERSAKKLAEAYLGVGVSDVELVVYRDARHEIFNETNAQTVRDDLIAWLDSRLSGVTA
jgi:alpha-beta hydrolase superfamily lysophospholipase